MLSFKYVIPFVFIFVISGFVHTSQMIEETIEVTPDGIFCHTSTISFIDSAGFSSDIELPQTELWHSYEVDAIYGSADVGNNNDCVFAGANLNDESAQLFDMTGDGSPIWIFPSPSSTDMYTHAANFADVLVAVEINAGQNNLYKWTSVSSTPDWIYTPSDSFAMANTQNFAIDNYGQYVAVFGMLGSTPTVRLLDTSDGSLIDEFQCPDGSGVRGIFFDEDGDLLIVRASNWIYVLENNGSTLTERWNSGSIASTDATAISPDGSIIAYGFTNMVVRQWNGSTYDSYFTYAPGGQYYVGRIVISGNDEVFSGWVDYGSYLTNRVYCHTTSSTPDWSYIYNTGTGGYQDIVSSIDCSTNGEYVIVGAWGDQGSSNEEITILDGDDGSFYFGIDTPGSVFYVDISSDGIYATGCGKHVHANQTGRGGDLYGIEVYTDIGINLTTFSAVDKGGKAMVLNWSCEATEGETIEGFNLYRREMGLTDGTTNPVGQTFLFDNKDTTWSQINDHLITGQNPYSFIDDTIDVGITYEYRLEALIEDMPQTIGTTTGTCGLPTSFAITSIHPNPAIESVSITLSIPESCDVKIEVYDITGRLIIDREVGEIKMGEYTEMFSTGNLSSGVYTVKATAGIEQSTKKVVIVR